MSDINVTPFVDVMLVLLAIFMITAPLMQHGIDVQLPREATETTTVMEIPTLTLLHNRRIFWNETEIETLVILEDELRKYIAVKKGEAGINLRADKSLDYGFVVKVLALVKRLGIERIGMITEHPE